MKRTLRPLALLIGVTASSASIAFSAPAPPRGVVTTSLERSGPSTGEYTRGEAITHDAHGRVLVAGSDDQSVVVVRYLANGRIDRRFAQKGILRTRVHRSDTTVSAITVDRRGRILIAASSTGSGSGRGSLHVLRLTARGAIDRTFGTRGIHTQPGSRAGDLLPVGDTTIVTGRSFQPSGAIVLRLDGRGRPDRSFGTDGVTRFSVYGSRETRVVGTSARAVARDAAGRILVQVGVFRELHSPPRTGLHDFSPTASWTPPLPTVDFKRRSSGVPRDATPSRQDSW